MPLIGLGTFTSRGLEVQHAVKWALEAGIKLIDTASIYKNEIDIKQAIDKVSGDHKSSVFLTSKLSPFEQGTEAAIAACEGILQRLGSVDLLLIHWPGVAKEAMKSSKHEILRHETWRVLESFYRAGRVRAIGVSNFSVEHLKSLLKVATILPAVNQVEMHPEYQQPELLEFCRNKGIAISAYGSLGSGKGKALSSLEVQQIASIRQKSPAQHGCAVIPKSIHKDRIEEFAGKKLLGWSLSPEHMAILDNMPSGPKLNWDSDLIP